MNSTSPVTFSGVNFINDIFTFDKLDSSTYKNVLINKDHEFYITYQLDNWTFNAGFKLTVANINNTQTNNEIFDFTSFTINQSNPSIAFFNDTIKFRNKNDPDLTGYIPGLGDTFEYNVDYYVNFNPIQNDKYIQIYQTATNPSPINPEVTPTDIPMEILIKSKVLKRIQTTNMRLSFMLTKTKTIPSTILNLLILNIPFLKKILVYVPV